MIGARTSVGVVLAALLVACGASPPAPAPVPAPDDGDHVTGAADACPAEPEDEDGWQDDDGCPDTDDDHDGLADVDDLCRCEVEDRDGFEDQDGCADPDNDGDRIVDACDACPNEPETYNGTCDEDGCPDHGYVCVEMSRIAIIDYVFFARGSAEIGARNEPLLDALVQTMLGNPQITLVAVVGSAEPRERRREALAHARAEAVRTALVARGVPSDRLVAEVSLEPSNPARGEPETWRRVTFSIRAIDGEAYDQDAMPETPPGGGCGAPRACMVPDCHPSPPTPPAC